MDAADLSPVPESQRTQPAFDLFLIFAAANVVATTLQTGAVLGARYGRADVIVLVVAGACFGAVLVALLAPVGSRTGLPSMIAARGALGYRGAQAVSALLYLTNFAWIAVNNTIAASVCAQMLGGSGSARLWSAALGVLATAVVARGPRAVGQADRIAVPLMVIAGGILTYAAFTIGGPEGSIDGPEGPIDGPEGPIDGPEGPIDGPKGPSPREFSNSGGDFSNSGGDFSSSGGDKPLGLSTPPPLLFGLDVVIGYQVSWLLMFADYSRYTRSARAASTAVFAGLALPALWLMPVGWNLARLAGSDDPGTMLAAAGVGWWTAILVALATVSTNFVNIYLSSLAWRTLSPRSTGAGTVWTIGLIGTALGLVSSGWLTRFAELMTWIGSILVPVGGVFLAHFVLLRRPIDIDAIYDLTRVPAISIAGVSAWIAGFAVYKLAAPVGATLPALATSVIVYALLHRIHIGETRVKP